MLDPSHGHHPESSEVQTASGTSAVLADVEGMTDTDLPDLTIVANAAAEDIQRRVRGLRTRKSLREAQEYEAMMQQVHAQASQRRQAAGRAV